MDTIQNQLNSVLKMTRGMILFRALIMLILGICMIFAPLQTLWWMTICIGAIVLIDGVMLLSASLQSQNDLRGVMLINAALLIILGVFSLISPLIMDMVWVMMLGIWQLLSGLQYLFLRKRARHTFFTLVTGILSVLAGLFFLLLPFGGLLAATWLIAIVLLVSAVMSFITAFKL